jgi:hypothetical protein
MIGESLKCVGGERNEQCSLVQESTRKYEFIVRDIERAFLGLRIEEKSSSPHTIAESAQSIRHLQYNLPPIILLISSLCVR